MVIREIAVEPGGFHLLHQRQEVPPVGRLWKDADPETDFADAGLNPGVNVRRSELVAAGHEASPLRFSRRVTESCTVSR